MSKISLNDVSNILGNPTTAAARLNANNDIVEQAFDNTISRNGQTPNQMEADFDMNHNDILNAENVYTDHLYLDGKLVVPEDLVIVNDDFMTKPIYDPLLKQVDVYSTTNETRDRLVDAPVLITKKTSELFFGFAEAGNEIFPGASSAIQGMADVVENGVAYTYVTSRCIVPDGNYTDTERCRIVKFPKLTNGGLANAVGWSAVINIGHGQDIGIYRSGGVTYIYTHFPVSTPHQGQDAGKGFARVRWRDGFNVTTDADVTAYQTFGYIGSGHKYERYNHGTVGISSDGKYVIIVANVDDADGRYVFWYDRAAVEAAGSGLSVRPYRYWRIKNTPEWRNNAFQGVVADQDFTYVAWGYYYPFLNQCIQIYTNDGNFVRQIDTEHIKVQYGLSALLDNPTLGIPAQIEIEGLSITNGRISFVILDTWRSATGTSIRSYTNGKNYACINATNANSGIGPWDPTTWVETTKAAGGAWSVSETGLTIGARTRRSKVIFEIGVPTGDPAEFQTVAGITNRPADGSIVLRGSNPDIVFIHPNTFQVKSYSENIEKYYNEFSWSDDGWHLFDSRVDANNSRFVRIYPSFQSGREFLGLTAGETNAAGTTLNLYGLNDSTFPDSARLFGSGGVERLLSDPTSFQFTTPPLPKTDITQSIGSSVKRWLRGWFGTLALVDGVTAPSTSAGHAVLYVDSADGDLKVKFGDGTVKTIVVDT